MTSTPSPSRPVRRGARAGLALAAAAAAGSSLVIVPPAFAADDAAFLSSFEEGEAQPSPSVSFDDPVNMSGFRYANGSLLGEVAAITASAENGPGEGAANLADGDASTKWLAFAETAWITYELSEPAVLREYTMTSGGDAEERDPRDWTVQGSDDGAAWTAVDTRAGEDFAGRGARNAYEVENERAYRFYRLDVTANSGAELTQLADWDIQDGSDEPAQPGPMTTVLGAGPISGYNVRPAAGFSGLSALRYGGAHVAEGAASAANLLFEGVDREIEEGDELSYVVFPVLDAELTYRSTYVAVDLVLDDGSRLSQLGLRDDNGFPVSARAQGEEKALYGSQWNSVRVDLSPLAGRTVTDVLLAYDGPASPADGAFSGWLDDVRIGHVAPVDTSSLAELVDTRRGTNSSGGYSRGNNIPATAVPNGFNFFTPMTDADSQSWLYSWAQSNNADNLPELQGLGISHEPSPWMGDRNQLAIMPAASATPSGDPDERAVAFRHGRERATPHHYRVELENDVVAEVAPTDHAGLLRFRFPGDDGSVLLDRVGGNGELEVTWDPERPDRFTAWVEGGSGLSVGRTRMFVAGEFSRDPSATGVTDDERAVDFASFDTSGDDIVELRIATSFIGTAQARHSLELEAIGRDLDEVAGAAEGAWNERLGVIEVEGATRSQLTTLYSNLYRLNLYPNAQHENVGSADAPEWRYASPVSEPEGEATATTTNATLVDGRIYVNNGFWDTYRTVWPAYSLLYPEVAQDLVDGFVQHARDGGWIARWSSPGYADLMTGTSSDVAFADAYVAGAIDTPTALDAYDAALKNATVLPTSSGVGRKGLDRSIFLGYTPEETHESVSWGLEGFINDFGIGRMAELLAEDEATPEDRRAQLREESAYFLDRATQYGNMFDAEAGFFQAKHIDGTWNTPSAEFDPERWGDPFTESNGWNFAFHAPFDIDGLAALHGGTDGLLAKLDEFFATPERGDNVGSYGGVIHEMLEARDVRMGQLGQSNQVSHHIPYLAAAAGSPSRTQEQVREIMQRLYVGSEIGQGYPGDEDNGEMSAWHVLSSLGIYPLALASGEYAIGSPLFEKATVHLEGGRDLEIVAEGNDWDRVYVDGVTFDGEPLDRAAIGVRDLARGGELRFSMTDEPSDWGARTSDLDAPRTPLVDATSPDAGRTTSDDGTATGPLVDDTSRTVATFTSATPTISWASVSGPVSIERYTLTNGASGDAPSSWRLEGSADGDQWVVLDERDGEAFRWATQTRPFELDEPAGPFEHYRIAVTGTAGGGAPTLAELELLASPIAGSTDFRLTAAEGLEARVGSPVDATLATLAGGTSADAADYDATVDFLDGEGPRDGVLERTRLGGWAVSAPHEFAEAGAHTARVTVAEGTRQASVDVAIAVSRDDSFPGAADSVCLGSIGAGGSCDVNGYTFLRDSLAAKGFVQGTTVAVPGDETLTFDLPAIEPGQPDNVLSEGASFAVDLGEGATRLAFIGTATQAKVELEATLHFADGTTAPTPLAFGDWTGYAGNPVPGSTIVAISEGRLQGDTSVVGGSPAIFATAPVAIPEGQVVTRVTMPQQTGDHQREGRAHVFAVASDGVRGEAGPLEVAPLEVGMQQARAAFEAEVASVSGGTGSYSATVNWGDGMGLAEAQVVDGVVSAAHEFAEAGEFTATVTVDDGVRSASVDLTVAVAAAPVYETRLAAPEDAVEAGTTAELTGSGFASGERIVLELAGGEGTPIATAEAMADGEGGFTADLPIPAATAEGVYAVTATGDVSRTPASADLEVAAAVAPEPGALDVRLSAQVARPGDAIAVSATGLDANETARITLNSTPVVLGEVAANADGVLAATVEIPLGVELGEHRISVLGLASGATGSAALTIAAVVPPGSGSGPAGPGTGAGGSGGALSTTGTDDPALLGGIAAGLLGLGALAIGLGATVRRRRESVGREG